MRMISLSLPTDLLARLDASQKRSVLLRDSLRAGLAAGLTGHRRRRNALGPSKQTTLLIDDELYEAMLKRLKRGQRNGFIEESLARAIAAQPSQAAETADVEPVATA